MFLQHLLDIQFGHRDTNHIAHCTENWTTTVAGLRGSINLDAGVVVSDSREGADNTPGYLHGGAYLSSKRISRNLDILHQFGIAPTEGEECFGSEIPSQES